MSFYCLSELVEFNAPPDTIEVISEAEFYSLAPPYTSCRTQNPILSIASFGCLLKTRLFQQYSAHWVQWRHCAIMRYINWILTLTL